MENERHERRPRTSITGENSDRVDVLIRENRRITLRELSGILNISEGSVKTIIKQQSFRSNEEVIHAVQEWLHCQPKDFFLSGIRKLPDRWRNCIAYQEDYVET